MHALVWKQWHESKLYLAVFTAWMSLAACYVVGHEMGHRYHAAVGSFSSFALFYGIVAAVFLAMRTARGEHTDGTISFSAALPVSLRQAATVRIMAAIGTLAVPILIGVCLVSLALAAGLIEQGAPRSFGGNIDRLPVRSIAPLPTSLEQLWSVAAINIFGGVELLLILCLLGCWLRTQAQVGMAGAVVSLGLLIMSDLLWYQDRHAIGQLIYGGFVPQSLVVHWGYAETEGGYTDHELALHRWAAIGLAIPLLACIGWLFIRWYGALSPAKIRHWRLRPALPALWSRVPLRLPSRWAAMIWLELRQVVPMTVLGLLLAVLLTVAGVVSEGRGSLSFDEVFRSDLPTAIFFLAELWAVIVGSSLFAADLSDGLGGFWRSRPISPRAWFWSKFLIGLVVVLGVLDGITIAVCWNAPVYDMMGSGMSWAYVACFPILHALMYALAVCGTCWLRRPVIGGIAAIVAYGLLAITVTAFATTNHLDPVNIYNELLYAERQSKVIDFTQHGYPLVYGLLTASIVGLALISARLARPLQSSIHWPLAAAIRAAQ